VTVCGANYYQGSGSAALVSLICARYASVHSIHRVAVT